MFVKTKSFASTVLNLLLKGTDNLLFKTEVFEAVLLTRNISQKKWFFLSGLNFLENLGRK
jgi:hypothetical protein